MQATNQGLWKLGYVLGLGVMAALATGCASTHPPLQTAAKVDLERFMGPWFVQGYTPILVDKDAHNAVEHYFLDEDNTVRTTYQFRQGGFDGKLKTYTPVGFIHNTETNAEWRMQFIWPFKAKYYVFFLSEDYQNTIIAHPNRKYAWIMSREPDMEPGVYAEQVAQLEQAGFDPAAVLRVPQDWTHEPDRLNRIRELGASAPLAR